MLWFFRAHAVKSNIGRRKNAKYHDVVNMAITDAFWRFAHTANVHVDNGGCSFAQNTKQKGNEGLENGKETGAPALCRWW